MDIDAAVDLVIGLAHDYSIETRVRRLIEAHEADGAMPRTLVMNIVTWRRLCFELEGRSIAGAYWWAPAQDGALTFFRGIPILIKDFVADQEVLVGV